MTHDKDGDERDNFILNTFQFREAVWLAVPDSVAERWMKSRRVVVVLGLSGKDILPRRTRPSCLI